MRILIADDDDVSGLELEACLPGTAMRWSPFLTALKRGKCVSGIS